MIRPRVRRGSRWVSLCWVAAALVAGSSAPASAQVPTAGAPAEAADDPLAPLARLHGRWRGSAWRMVPGVGRVEMIQTERIGPFLGGEVHVVEGRGYDTEGKVVFNALGIFSYDAPSERVMMRSYAQGRTGDFPVKLLEDGFEWEIEVGPARIVYRAKITDGRWVEYGERIVPGQDPIRFFEMTLERIGDEDWPGAGAVPPQ